MDTFADVLDRFRNHPKSKSADSEGNPAGRWTIGLLQRRHVEPVVVFHIGKETNLLEQQEEGVLVTDPQAIYLGEDDQAAIRSLLKEVSIPALASRIGNQRADAAGDSERGAEGVRPSVEGDRGGAKSSRPGVKRGPHPGLREFELHPPTRCGSLVEPGRLCRKRCRSPNFPTTETQPRALRRHPPLVLRPLSRKPDYIQQVD